MHFDVAPAIRLDTCDPGAWPGELSSELIGGFDRDGGDAVGSRDGEDVGAVRRSEQLLEPIRCEFGRLRKEREDAATVVVDDDRSRRSVLRAASPASAFVSCTNARSPIRTAALPVSRAMPSAVEVTPSMPLAPRLACARAAVPPNHSWSRTGIEELTTRSTASGRCAATIRATDGSVNSPARSKSERVAAIAASAAICAACQSAVHSSSGSTSWHRSITSAIEQRASTL